MLIYFDKEHLSKIGKYFPAFLIFLGSLKLIVFYQAFGIKIVEFLDFSEVLISFLDSVIFYVAIILIPAFIFLSFWGKSLGEYNTQSYNSYLELTFFKRLTKSFKENKFFFIFGVLYTVIFILFGKWNEHTIALFIMYPGVYIILFLVQEIRIAYRKQYDYVIPITYVNVGIFLISMTSYIIYDTLNTAYDIKNYKKYLGSEIQIENKVIKSDSILTYIGQTKNYIFFYNRKNKESTTYPKNKLVSIKLVNN